MSSNKGRPNEFACVDCEVDTGKINEYYMVLDTVWSAAKMQVGEGSSEEDERTPVENDTNPDGMLCIGCLENRLDRVLTHLDFSKAPLNWLPFVQRSPRLKSRLEGYIRR